MKTFRSKIEAISRGRVFLLLILTACLALSIVWGAAGYYLGMVIIVLILWSSHWDFSRFGLSFKNVPQAFWKAFLYSLGLYILIDLLIQPFLESFLGELDLGALDGLRGNPLAFILSMLAMWIFAAFGEELFYRGFLMKRIAELMGPGDEFWFLAAVINGVYFGLAHLYQGLTGVIITGLVGFLFGLLFMKKRSLLILVLIHGIYDSIGLTLIFIEKDKWLVEIISSLFNF